MELIQTPKVIVIKRQEGESECVVGGWTRCYLPTWHVCWCCVLVMAGFSLYFGVIRAETKDNYGEIRVRGVYVWEDGWRCSLPT